MRKRTGEARKARPKKDEKWFRRKVAALKAALEKLPAVRQEQFKRRIEREIGK